MTKISDIYNEVVDVLETNLPEYIRMPNPYVATENTYRHLRKSYGLAVGPGFDTKRETCKINWQRTFSILLVKQMVATQNDTGVRELIEQELLDMHDVLRKQFYNSSLGGNAYNVGISADSGIFFIDGDKLQFIGIELSLDLEYQETLLS